MIESFKHKGLKKLYQHGDQKQLDPRFIGRIEDILARLDVADVIQDMNLPGYSLHALKGTLKNQWSVLVSRNWRIIFRFENGSVFDVDLIDYH